MAQHYNICGLKVKYCQKIEHSLKQKFDSGIGKIRSSLRFIEELRFDAKEHKDDAVFYTKRIVGSESENLEIHFDEKRKKITKIYIVK